ncbi:RNA polymerase sigma factor [Rhodococcus sp. NBC_00297]|uniref:RNA polymerase sigma factor n=1 Tax=Rhodococcus sp. NBC_00297 TaxID=2976005 RepID=UPI002E282DDC|nr:sigma-70 family RNA polymerase sigma factor [Rhodococcus sp. NBC_00297]
MAEDEQRFAALYRQTHSRVLAYAKRRAPADTAREATDEAYLIAWRRFASVPEDALPWLIITVRNVLSELHRRDERQTVLAQRLADTRRDQDTAPDHVEDAVVEKVVVLSALSTLSEADRETLMLISWDGLTARQAASVVGCSPPTFAVRHHRARRRLDAALDAAAADQPRAHPTSPDRSRP